MLTLLVLSAVCQLESPVPPVEALAPKDVVWTLIRDGYEVVPGSAKLTEGTIRRDDATVTYQMLPASDRPGDPKADQVAEIVFWMTFPIGEDPPIAELKPGPTELRRAFDLWFTPSIGRTALLVAVVGPREGLSAKLVRTAFDDAWRAGNAYAHRHRGAFVTSPERDWTAARFADSTFIPFGEAVSVARAMQSWGFKPVDADRRLPFEPPQTFLVQGTLVDVNFERLVSDGSDDRLSLYSEVRLPDTADVGAWIEAHRLHHRAVGISDDYNGVIVVTQDARRSKGVRLGDLRDRVERFAALVARLKDEAPSPP